MAQFILKRLIMEAEIFDKDNITDADISTENDKYYLNQTIPLKVDTEKGDDYPDSEWLDSLPDTKLIKTEIVNGDYLITSDNIKKVMSKEDFENLYAGLT